MYVLLLGGNTARRLMEVSKPILTNSQCRSAYGSSYDSNTMLCSGILGTGGKDACQVIRTVTTITINTTTTIFTERITIYIIIMVHANVLHTILLLVRSSQKVEKNLSAV